MEVGHVGKRDFWLVACLTLTLAGAGCSKAEDPWKRVQGGPPRVLTSFPPLYCLAKNVGGTDVGVLSLLDRSGPHGYDPGAYDSLKVQGADLVLVNGLGLDNFISRVVNSSGNKKVKVIELGKDVKPLLPMQQHEGHHHEGDHDPHVWLGIPQAVQMVERIATELSAIDPSRKERYRERAAAYIEKLNGLQAEGIKALAGKKNRKIITQHDSLGYFAKTFNLEVVGNFQISPGIEADTNRMIELEKLIKEKDVRVIAVEPQYSREKAERLRDQLRKQKGKIEVEIVTVDPLETAPPDFTESYYLDKMRENIHELAKKLP
jgi:ABC-type Zn uptake system ZnuABC Zn-binding protein ZnuA